MAPKHPRAGAGLLRTATKRDRAAASYLKVVEDEENEENAADLKAIIEALTKDPHKIKLCKRAVLGNLFNTQMASEMERIFPVGVCYIYKVPKDSVRSILSAIVPEALQTRLTAFEKHMKGSLHKLMCRACQVEMNCPMPTRETAAFYEMMVARGKRVGITEKDISAAAGDKIDWQASGWFKLHPAMPAAGTNAENHRYTDVELLGVQAKLPAWLNIDGAWKIEENWSVNHAHLHTTHLGRKPPNLGTLIDCFDPQDITLEPKLVAAPEVQPGLVDVAKHQAAASSSSESMSTPPPKRHMLTPPQKQARKLSVGALKAVLSSTT